MHPALIKSILRPGSLDQIVQELRTLRGETQHTNADSKWLKLLDQLNVDDQLARLREAEVDICVERWFVICQADVNLITGHRQLYDTVATFGLKGALARPHPTATSKIDDQAGYLSRADLVLRRGTDPFAVVEFKMDRHPTANKPWYELDAVLAQIFCGLSGSETCRFGLVLTQTGYKLLYRIKISREGDRDIYNYYIYPSETPLARFDTDKIKFIELLRIIAELTLTSSRNPDISTANKITNATERINVSNRGPVDDTSVESLTDKLADLKMSVDQFTSHQFAATLFDGSLLPLEGLSNFSKEFLNENYESSSESEYD